ncbi:hypothetical protein QR680_013025 [Steinernema hermaphroditum]|uniref:Uncharacterized protein n=1 Tax=Steinernema hermaphroditum TaxID=289476 RepID=A0AA39I672_9BILA|nr:hypothetical protein QR680_013025 [Steinernema hermaphroditum]
MWHHFRDSLGGVSERSKILPAIAVVHRASRSRAAAECRRVADHSFCWDNLTGTEGTLLSGLCLQKSPSGPNNCNSPASVTDSTRCLFSRYLIAFVPKKRFTVAVVWAENAKKRVGGAWYWIFGGSANFCPLIQASATSTRFEFRELVDGTHTGVLVFPGLGSAQQPCWNGGGDCSARRAGDGRSPRRESCTFESQGVAKNESTFDDLRGAASPLMRPVSEAIVAKPKNTRTTPFSVINWDTEGGRLFRGDAESNGLPHKSGGFSRRRIGAEVVEKVASGRPLRRHLRNRKQLRNILARRRFITVSLGGNSLCAAVRERRMKARGPRQLPFRAPSATGGTPADVRIEVRFEFGRETAPTRPGDGH